ncbi:MAG: hypothetical protein IJ480_09930, partial [Clostridia bacterium]|nr:hypothetical protein [Clostridia bacterium]
KKLTDKLHEINRIGMYHIGMQHFLSKPEVCTKDIVIYYTSSQAKPAFSDTISLSAPKYFSAQARPSRAK